MRRLRDYFDVGFAVLWEHNRWVLGTMGVMAIAGVTVGVLFVIGVLGGVGESLDDLSVEQTPQANVAGKTPATMPVNTDEIAKDFEPEAVSTPAPTALPKVVAILESGRDPNDRPDPDFPATRQVEVPINLLNASDLGSLEFLLVYEPATMEFVEVVEGVLGVDPVIETNLRAPGRVWVGIIDPQGVNGDGAIAVVSFRTLEGGQADSPLSLEEITGHHATTLLDAPSRSTPGILTANDGWFSPPSLLFE